MEKMSIQTKQLEAQRYTIIADTMFHLLRSLSEKGLLTKSVDNYVCQEDGDMINFLFEFEG